MAWYGAIVASLSFAFSVYQIRRDSSRIKISLEKGLSFHNASPLYKENTDYVGVNVINKGRRPIKITHAAFKILGNEGSQFLLADSFADHRVQVLTEENPKTQFFVEVSLVDVSKIWCIDISDGAGNQYRKYTKKLPTFMRIIYYFKNLRNKNE